ncbi:protease Lon-related BREX system protein BrxL [candidate division KSB1 bacterium]|nr:protease Lon-related BREX system protein BrxL [candidate division KSB1 bacterium]
MIDLDKKVNQVFPGKVVRKDLVRKVKVGANVPVYVLEYLLGKYCATDEELAIQSGLQIVNDIISKNVINPDESNKAKAWVKENGEYTFIDKAKVRLIASEDKYWAELVNFNDNFIHISNNFIRQYERLLEGGVWSEVKLQYMYDEEQKGRKSPFWIKELKPIQLASFDFADYKQGRTQFTTEEWIDVLIASIGLEPSVFDARQKLLILVRMIPMVENNFNLIELGPRGTGKSFVYREISPFSILISGGKTTVANLFYNMASRQVGLVGYWDVVAFDEVGGMDLRERDVVDILKDYMEAGSFSRGKDEITAKAGMCFLGNVNLPIEVLTKTSHLFQPLPDKMVDPALIDRFHFYLPGWEFPKMSNELFTNRYGFVVDYLAEAFREARKLNFTEKLDHYYSLGDHLNARDAKAVRKAVAGLVKMIHPDGNVTKDEIRNYIQIALEGRRRVKEQLKKMLSFEYAKTSFSFIDNETREEAFVGVPEEGGRDLIMPDPLAPGNVYSIIVDPDGKPGLFRIEVGISVGTGKIHQSGGMQKLMKESLQRAFVYLKSRKVEYGIGKEVDNTDFHVECVNLLGTNLDSAIGVAFFVAMYSALKKKSVKAATVILGDMTIQGNIKPLTSVQEPLQIGMDNGARKACIPIENKRHFLEVPADIVEQVDPIFFSEPMVAAQKCLE